MQWPMSSRCLSFDQCMDSINLSLWICDYCVSHFYILACLSICLSVSTHASLNCTPSEQRSFMVLHVCVFGTLCVLYVYMRVYIFKKYARRDGSYILEHTVSVFVWFALSVCVCVSQLIREAQGRVTWAIRGFSPHPTSATTQQNSKQTHTHTHTHTLASTDCCGWPNKGKRQRQAILSIPLNETS